MVVNSCMRLLVASLLLHTWAAALGMERSVFFPDPPPLEPPSLLSTLASSFQTYFDRPLPSFLLPSAHKTPKHQHHPDGFPLASAPHHYAAPLLLSSADDVAIHIAAQFFVDDVYRVTGVRPKMYNDSLPSGTERAVVVGTVGSEVVQGMRAEEEDWLEEMKGRWEVWDVRVREGKHGLKEGMFVTGSDRRGVIFGLYELSEQLGVSPFYWWDDVPSPHHPVAMFNRSLVLSHGEPTIKFRGLFINDELPSLWNWARERFHIPPPEGPFQVGMYERVFELVLRLKGNYMWPAMWASMFYADGQPNPYVHGLPKEPLPGPNHVLASKMGVVMGTSHHEPMARNKQEWDLEGKGSWDWTNREFLEKWWEYGAERAKGLETMFTVGMRGDGDKPLTGGSPELVQNITEVQRGILRKVLNKTDLSDVPQLWVMYKEVQGYFQDGMEVPEDVTIMLSDDNWGNIMATPPMGKDHKAGYGLYYHGEYVGRPRDYKWINTISLAKMWEQLDIARAFNMNQVWILNVGDLKMLEIPLDYFMSLAYDSARWPRNSLDEWFLLWAKRDFGEEVAEDVAWVMARYSRYTSRIKPELLNSTLWSMENYEEAERLVAEYDALEARSERVYQSLSTEARTAYFELVHAVVKLTANLNRLYVAVGKNNAYADQARTATNLWADKARLYFDEDRRITREYHELYDGRWDHMLAQTHINWNYFLESQRDTLPPISFIDPYLPSQPSREGNPPGLPAYIRITPENSRGAWPGISKYNCGGRWNCWNPWVLSMDPYGNPTRWVDVSSGGPKNIEWHARGNESWLLVDKSHGKLSLDGGTDQRVYISVDWEDLPTGGKDGKWSGVGEVEFSSSDGNNVTLFVPVVNVPHPKDYQGFVEGDGYVVMEARHFASNRSTEGHAWEDIEWYGRTESGLSIHPVGDFNYTAGEGPSLSYKFWSTGARVEEKKVQVTVQMGPSFNFMLGKKLAFALSMDGSEPKVVTPIPNTADLDDIGTVPVDWPMIVSSEIRNVTMEMELGGDGVVGEHDLTIWGMTAGVVVERVWVDMGGIVERGYSYLGPPESRRV